MTHETTHGDFTSAVLLLNGYVDFGTWWGITPFVGAGVGFARNMLSGFSDTSLTTIAGVTTPSGGGSATATRPTSPGPSTPASATA